MKKLVVWCVTISLCIPVGAMAANPFVSFDQSPQMFLYVKVPLGARSKSVDAASLGPRFGLSLNREFAWQSSAWPSENSSLWTHRSLPVMSFEFDSALHGSQINGLNMSSSGDESIWHNPWLYVGIAAGALLISCATDNFPCESSGGGGHSGSGGGY